MMQMPNASKSSAISFASGAPPEIGSRRRPPRRSFTFENTRRSASRCWSASPGGIGFPSRRNALSRRPTASAQSISRRRAPVASANVAVTTVWHLLVHPRHARQDRRPHLRDRPRDVERVGQEGDRVAEVRAREVHQPPEVVRQREVQQHDVAGPAVVGQLVGDGDHRVVVAVPDHAALRRAGRARRVDEREEVLLVDRGGRLVEPLRVRLAVRTPFLLERGQVGEREDVAERGEARPARVHLVALRIVLAHDADRLRMLEDVLGVARRRIRVDRGAHGADVREREVDERPFERVPRQDSEGIALADAAREQAVRDQLDPFGRLAPGDLPPAVRPSTRYAGPLLRATASRHRRGIVRSAPIRPDSSERPSKGSAASPRNPDFHP